MKLQKYFSVCGILSRRAAETEIAAGNVTVNGIRAEIGAVIDPENDHVAWNGKPVVPPAERSGYTYIMLNKPIGYVTTMNDDRGRKTVADLLRGVPHRVYPIGRLDMYSEGMLLFTDDGDLANRLMHPSHHCPKEYIVTLKGVLSSEDAKQFTKPMQLDGYRLQPVEASLLRSGFQRSDGTVASQILLTLHEGRNRQIRRMCEQLQFRILRLQRIHIGTLELGDLPCGKWRYLTEQEISYLQSISGKESICL